LDERRPVNKAIRFTTGQINITSTKRDCQPPIVPSVVQSRNNVKPISMIFRIAARILMMILSRELSNLWVV